MRFGRRTDEEGIANHQTISLPNLDLDLVCNSGGVAAVCVWWLLYVVCFL